MAHESRRYCPYLCELATCGEPTRTLSHRTQNPVVREHRVGSSPTSGTGKIPANTAKISVREGKPRRSRRGRLLQPYCNPSTEGFLEGAGRAVLHVGEHVGVGIQGDGDA